MISRSSPLARQRFSRAAAFGSRVIILDRPTGVLSAKESRRVLEVVLDVNARSVPIILISHTMPHVVEVADRSHVRRLGKRLSPIHPNAHGMGDAVPDMTAVKTPDPAHAA
jgi:fructose transport system ATP-binding protein